MPVGLCPHTFTGRFLAWKRRVCQALSLGVGKRPAFLCPQISRHRIPVRSRITFVDPAPVCFIRVVFFAGKGGTLEKFDNFSNLVHKMSEAKCYLKLKD